MSRLLAGVPIKEPPEGAHSNGAFLTAQFSPHHYTCGRTGRTPHEATETSTVTFLSVPDLACAKGGDLTFLQLAIGFIVGRLVVFLFLPHYFRGELSVTFACGLIAGLIDNSFSSRRPATVSLRIGTKTRVAFRGAKGDYTTLSNLPTLAHGGGIEKEGVGLAAHRLAAGDWRDAFEQGMIRGRLHAVAEDIDDGRAAGTVGAVLVRSVDRHRVMEGAIPLGQFDGDRPEGCLLLGGENALDRLHPAGQARDRQQVPAVAAGHIVQAAVVAGSVVQGDPTGQMGHGPSASPVGVVLVPGDHAAMPGRFAKELIVPEADCPAQQLRRGDGEGRVPEQIVEPRRDPPRAQGVEQDRVRIARFVGVVLVEQLVAGLRRTGKAFELCAKHVHLVVVQKANARQIALPMVELHLLVAQPVLGTNLPQQPAWGRDRSPGHAIWERS